MQTPAGRYTKDELLWQPHGTFADSHKLKGLPLLKVMLPLHAPTRLGV